MWVAQEVVHGAGDSNELNLRILTPRPGHQDTADLISVEPEQRDYQTLLIEYVVRRAHSGNRQHRGATGVSLRGDGLKNTAAAPEGAAAGEGSVGGAAVVQTGPRPRGDQASFGFTSVV